MTLRTDDAFLPKGKAWLAAAGLVILIWLVFSPGLSHKLTHYDDSAWIDAVKPPHLTTLGSILTYDRERWAGLGYFAPLTAMSLMLDVWAGEYVGKEAPVLKATNVLLHSLNCVLVLLLLRTLGFDLWIAFTVAAAFSVHPLQVSTIAWIAERKNLLMSLFFLAALITHVRYRRDETVHLYAAVFSLYLLSLLSKPSAVALGPCLIATDWFLIDRRLTARSIVRAMPFVLVGLAWILVATGTEGEVRTAPPLLDRMLLAPYVIGFLVWKFFAPADLSLFYSETRVDAGLLVWWAPLVAFAALAGAALAIHRRHPAWRFLWALSFYLINLVPSSGLVPFRGMGHLYVADHYQYLAVIGEALALSLTAAWIADRIEARAGLILKAVFSCAMIASWSLLSVQQLDMWKDAHTLWRTVTARNPTSYIAIRNYADWLDEEGLSPEAEKYYRRALSIDPGSAKLWYNLGVLMMRQGRLNDAMDYLGKALEIRPGFGDPHLAQAKIFFFRKDYQQALAHCRIAQQLGAECRPEELDREIEARKSREGNR